MTNPPSFGRKILVHIVILVFFILYLISADALFDTIIPVTDESHSQDLSIPNENGDIIYFIDSVRVENLEWKKVLSIQGFAFDNQSNETNTEVFLFLESGKSYKSFNTFTVKRPDVTIAYIKLQKNLDNSGFVANIPIYHLNEGRNRIILVLRNSHGIHFIKTDSYILKINDQAYPGFLSEKQEFSFANASQNLTFNIDKIETKATIWIQAWAFTNDRDNLNIEKFVFLESENSSYLFDTLPTKRPDVTSFFKNLSRSLDDSGFYGNIPISAIRDGHYRIGIVVKSNNETYLVRSNQTLIKFNDQIQFP